METHYVFDYAFIIGRDVFSVSYHKHKGNADYDFTTQAGVFNHPRTDFNRGGQCQDEVLPKTGTAREFWEKWHKKHLQPLTNDEMQELRKDLQEMEKEYPFVKVEDSCYDVNFSEMVALARNNKEYLESLKKWKPLTFGTKK